MTRKRRERPVKGAPETSPDQGLESGSDDTPRPYPAGSGLITCRCARDHDLWACRARVSDKYAPDAITSSGEFCELAWLAFATGREHDLPMAPVTKIDTINPDGAPVWVVRCPHCRREHVHGPGNGPAVADCYPEPDGSSQYLVTAYDGREATSAAACSCEPKVGPSGQLAHRRSCEGVAA